MPAYAHTSAKEFVQLLQFLHQLQSLVPPTSSRIRMSQRAQNQLFSLFLHCEQTFKFCDRLGILFTGDVDLSEHDARIRVGSVQVECCLHRLHSLFSLSGVQIDRCGPGVDGRRRRVHLLGASRMLDGFIETPHANQEHGVKDPRERVIRLHV